MNKTSKDILSQLTISDELINKTLKHQLSEEDQRVMDEAVRDSEFLQDGLEGLSDYTSLDTANRQATDLNNYLLQQLKTKNKKRNNRTLKHSTTTTLTIIGILILIVVVFYLLFVIPHKL